MKPVAVNALPQTSATTPVLLGLASFHASGYVRQSAIACLDRVTSGGEIPFLLLRLNDWVASVRQQAEEAIARRLTAAHRDCYLQNLSLVERLRGRRRATQSPTLAEIEHLLGSDLPKLLAAALASQPRVVRRYGLSLAWQAAARLSVSASASVIVKLLETGEQEPRLQVARWLTSQDSPPALQEQFLPPLLVDRFVAVRRLSLSWCATRDPRAHAAVLRAALLDESRAMRAIAQFHLPKLESIDLRRFYQDAVRRSQNDHPGTLKAALGGLAETGRQEDAELVVPFVHSMNVGIRKAALATLAKLAAKDYLEVFLTALQERSPGVSRQARLALEPFAQHIGAHRLEKIFFETANDHVRTQTLLLINRVSKWQKLPLLIHIADLQSGPLGMKTHRLLWDWLLRFNCTHQLQPKAAEITCLRQMLATHGRSLDHRLARELHAVLEAFTRS